MRRDPSLIPLSRQHHNALAMGVLARRALAEDSSAENIARLAQKVIDRYELELVNHFEIEEKILFPAIVEIVGARDLVAELVAQHRQVEGLIAQLRHAPTRERLESLFGLLDRHIRREENELFQRIQATVSVETLRQLGMEIEAKAVQICL